MAENQLTGLSMQRTRQEAESIVNAKYSNLSERDYLLLVNHYTHVKDWACANCHQTGTLVKVDSSIRTADCICKIIRKRKLIADKLRKESNIPPRYHDADLRKWINVGRNETERRINDDGYKVIESYVGNLSNVISKGYGLYLTGPNGVGKTYLACAIANKTVMLAKSVRYYTMAVIIQNEIRGWRDDEAAAIVKGIKKADLLIIDDLDKIYKTSTGIERALFDNLLRERLQGNKPCIFTSNRTIKDTHVDFSSHVASMLQEHCAEIVLVGQDHRQVLSSDIRRSILNGG